MAVRRLRALSLAFVFAMAAARSDAQVQSIPPFTGGAVEHFDLPLYQNVTCLATGIFAHQASMCTPSGLDSVITTGAQSNCPVYPYVGQQFFLARQGVWEITFDTAALRFGGWFATFSSNVQTTFQFFDVDDHWIATESIPSPPTCTWTWFGWDLSAGPHVKRILAQSSDSFFMVDELEVDLAPYAPTPYCTAGMTTHGCSASISANANPKVAYTSACQITVAGVEGQKIGVVYYGLSKQLLPWCTGGLGASTLCVKPPILSTTPQSSAGTAGQCNGAFHLDWNAYQLAHAGALGSPWIVGEHVYVQAWFRDPPACRSMNLSNALQLTYRP